MKKLFRKLGLLSFLLAFGLATSISTAWAKDNACDVCRMNIPEKAKNHLLLRDGAEGKTTFHLCSIGCARKARKHNAKLTTFEAADFNHPDHFLKGEKAFFLIKSENIKKDIGDMAMPPYLGAFTTRAEAEAARKKYGDGEVIQGVEKLFQ